MTTPRRQRRSATGQSRAKGVEQEPIRILLRWEGIDDVPILMANQIFVRYQEGQVILTFGQALPPYELQIREETMARLQREGAPCRAVAQVAIAPVKLKGVIRVLNEIQGRINGLADQEAKDVTETES